MISDRLALIEAVNEIGSLTAKTFDEQRHLALAEAVVSTLDSRVRASYLFSVVVPTETGRKTVGEYEERIGEYKITKHSVFPFELFTNMVFEHYQTGLYKDMYDINLSRVAIAYHQKNLKLYGIMIQEDMSFHIPFLLTLTYRGSRYSFLWARNNLIRRIL